METSSDTQKRKPRPTPIWLYGVIFIGLMCGIAFGVGANQLAHSLKENWDWIEANGSPTIGEVTGRSSPFENSKKVTYRIMVDGRSYIFTDIVRTDDWAVMDRGVSLNVVYAEENGDISAHIAGNTYPHEIMRYYAIGSWICTLLPGGLLAVIFLMKYFEKAPPDEIAATDEGSL